MSDRRNERYRMASRVSERHEIRLADGQWVRVTKARTISTLGGALAVRQFFWDGGEGVGIRPTDDVMSRLSEVGSDA